MTTSGATRPTAAEVLAHLRGTTPSLHRTSEDEVTNLRIQYDALEWIANAIRPGDRTLETGCGYTTVTLMACGAKHTVVSPSAGEHEAVAAQCAELGLTTDALTFVCEGSETALPKMEPTPLDFVLVDGCHAFPWPFLDWFYTVPRLAVGGHVMVDDTHLRTGAVLRSFLEQEAGRWEPVAHLKRTSVFRKLTEDIHEVAWPEQPWGAQVVKRRLMQRLVWRA